MNPTIPAAPKFTSKDLGEHCLVTGGAGYLGKRIIRRLLEAGCRVRSFDVIEHQHDGDVECVVGDLRDYKDISKACEGIDTVFHAAAIIKILEVARPAIRRFVYDVNVQGTRNMVRAAESAGVKALVQTSTFAVVMDRELDGKDETLPYATQSKDLYCLTKIEAEKAVLAGDKPGGLRTCSLRPGGLWGSDTNCIMIKSILDQLAKDNFKVLIGNGKATMDNTHVENLVDAELLAAKALNHSPEQVGGQAYFIVDDEQLNALEWFRPLVEGLDMKFPTFRLPGPMMKAIARSMEWAHYFGAPEPILTVRGIRNMTETSSFRIDKARKHFGYEPRYKLANGIPELLPDARAYVEEQRNNAAKGRQQTA
ncbi:MAG: NAD-dependent epimerase/dehydratase family protein [Nevskiales bacterium]